MKLDEAGDWPKAVQQATSAEGSTKSLDAVDAAAKKQVTDNATSATDDLRSGRTLALLFSGLTLLLGIVAAVAIARGIGERRREFA